MKEIESIKGKFTQSEWKFMADSLNGTLFRPEQRKSPYYLIAEFEDSQKYDGKGDKWSVDVKELNKKIESLTGDETEAVINRIENFWDNSDSIRIEDWSNY